MRRSGVVAIILVLGCGGGGGGGGGDSTKPVDAAGTGGAGGGGGGGGNGDANPGSDAPIVDSSTPSGQDANSKLPDRPPSPDGASVADAVLDSTLVVQSDGGAGADAQPSCAQAGSSCATSPAVCCAGTTCTNFPDLGGSFCAANCTTGDGCNSGCCVPLEKGGGVCGASSYCATCKKAGQEGCVSDTECCGGAACITELSGGVATRNVCKDHCTANTDCYSGCCAAVNGATYRVCSAASFCTTVTVPTSSTQAAGTYPVTVSREDADLYKVQGKTIWIKTQFCFQFVYFDSATLVWGGKYAAGNKIRFSSGQECTVTDILSQ